MRIAVVVTQMNGNMRERRESERERRNTIRIVERMIIPLMIGRGLFVLHLISHTLALFIPRYRLFALGIMHRHDS